MYLQGNSPVFAVLQKISLFKSAPSEIPASRYKKEKTKERCAFKAAAFLWNACLSHELEQGSSAVGSNAARPGLYGVQTRKTTYVWRNTEARSLNYCCRGKAICVTYSEWVRVCVVWVIQHAKRMRRIILPSMAWLSPPYFSTLSHKRHEFREKVIENKMCVLVFSTTFTWNNSHSTKNSSLYYHEYTQVLM